MPTGQGVLQFRDFERQWAPMMETLCREIYRENRDRIAVKKEKVAVRNMKKIFEAALSLSREKGFDKMTLRDLSRHSGLSMGALYSYFSGKEELRSIIQKQGVIYARRIIGEQVEKAQGPTERLGAAIRTHLYLSELLRAWFYFSYMEAGSLPEDEKKEAMRAELATEAIFRGILEEGVRGGDFGDIDVGLVAAAIKAILQDWYIKRWKYKQKDVSVQEYADFTVDFVLSAISSR